MERTHATTNSKHGARVMFRENRPTNDLFLLRMMSPNVHHYGDDPDADAGCGESCDINAEIPAIDTAVNKPHNTPQKE